MPQIRLTEKSIEKLKAPDPSGRQVIHWDDSLRGFAVLCSGVSNSKTYIAQRDLPSGKTRRVTVGAVNEISLEIARERAANTLDDIRRGIDPKEKQAIAATLRSTLDTYLAARKDLRPASVKAYRTGVEKYLKNWLDWPLHDITSEMVEARHSEIASEIKGERYKGTTTANATMRALRAIWNFAADRTPDLPPNPVRRLRRQWYPEPRRERIVRTDELPSFYQAVCALPNQIARDHILLMLFTGLRLSESASLRWDDIDLIQRVIRLPATATKAKRPLSLPMSDFVRDLLVARRAIGNAGFVFPAPGKAGHIVDPSFSLKTVAEASGVKVSAHDLRRTYVTVAESMDVSPMAIKALVNHAVGSDVTSGYAIMTTERLREAAQRVCDRLKELCGVAPPAGANVAKLNG